MSQENSFHDSKSKHPGIQKKRREAGAYGTIETAYIRKWKKEAESSEYSLPIDSYVHRFVVFPIIKELKNMSGWKLERNASVHNSELEILFSDGKNVEDSELFNLAYLLQLYFTKAKDKFKKENYLQQEFLDLLNAKDLTSVRRIIDSEKQHAREMETAASFNTYVEEKETPEYTSPKYLMTSEELLDPKVGAIEIGLLVTGKFDEIKDKMDKLAIEQGIKKPIMIADLIYKEGKRSELGSSGQPYPIVKEEWEIFSADVPEYCGENIPKIYMVDGGKYTAGI